MAKRADHLDGFVEEVLQVSAVLQTRTSAAGARGAGSRTLGASALATPQSQPQVTSVATNTHLDKFVKRFQRSLKASAAEQLATSEAAGAAAAAAAEGQDKPAAPNTHLDKFVKRFQISLKASAAEQLATSEAAGAAAAAAKGQDGRRGFVVFPKYPVLGGGGDVTATHYMVGVVGWKVCG